MLGMAEQRAGESINVFPFVLMRLSGVLVSVPLVSV